MANGRRRNLLIAGGVAALLVAGGTVAGVLLLGDDTRQIEDDRPREPVAEAPEEQWSWSGTATSAASVGEHLVLGTDSEVIALDEDGKELWTSDAGGYAYAVPRYPDLVFVSAPAFDHVVALSIEDGDELWTVENGYVDGSAEAGLIFTDVDEEDVGLLDAETGEEVWSQTGVDGYTVTDDAVYVLDGGQLSRHAIDTGAEEWSVSTDFASDDHLVTLVANDDMVALGDDRVVAFDAADGAELWSEDVGTNAELDVFSADKVAVATPGGKGESPGVAAVYDSAGKVGDVEAGAEPVLFLPEPFEVDGRSFVYDHASGRVFDEELQELGRYDGQGTVVDGGLYTLQDNGEVSYYEVGSDSPEWTIDTAWSEDSEVGLVPLDGRLVVVTPGEVTSYR